MICWFEWKELISLNKFLSSSGEIGTRKAFPLIESELTQLWISLGLMWLLNTKGFSTKKKKKSIFFYLVHLIKNYIT